MKEQSLVSWTNIQLDLFDRLRVLFGATIQLKVTTTVPQELPISMYNAISELKIANKSKFNYAQDRPTFGLYISGSDPVRKNA